jgi:hypothetical protein
MSEYQVCDTLARPNFGQRTLYNVFSPDCRQEFFSETRSTEGSNLPHTYSAS